MDVNGKEITSEQLDEAVHNLRFWREAGEGYANRGGQLEELDHQVDVALEELAWRRDPIEAEADEIERPTLRRFVWAMKGLKANKDTGNFGDDIKVVHAWLRANP